MSFYYPTHFIRYSTPANVISYKCSCFHISSPLTFFKRRGGQRSRVNQLRISPV